MSIAIELEGVLRPASHRETGEFYRECYSAVSGKGGECENGRLPPCLDVRADFAQIHTVSLATAGGGRGWGDGHTGAHSHCKGRNMPTGSWTHQEIFNNF